MKTARSCRSSRRALKQVMSRGALSAALSAWVFMVSASAMAVTVTQGEFAMALTYALNIEAGTADGAAAALEELEVTPDKGWQLGELMTKRVAEEIERALGRAVVAGLLKPVEADGAVATAAASLDMDYEQPIIAPRETLVTPWDAPAGGPLNDPVFIEGSSYRPIKNSSSR